MFRKFQLYPGGYFLTVPELESHLEFRFLSSITFENSEDYREALARGKEKQEQEQVSSFSLELGYRFIREIEASFLPQVSIRWVSSSVGYGLFAEEELAEETYAGEYTGIVRRNDRRYGVPLNNYCYEYPISDEIGRSWVIDATNGHLTRFINHSFTPNLKPVHVFYEGFYHLIFLTLRKIEKGEQLSYNYGQSYWYLRQPPRILYG